VIDSTVTVVTYKSKTVQSVLTEIAGLLVFTRILTFFLRLFNEWSFNRKIIKETNEDFREVFTYSNFKMSMKENQETKIKIQEIIQENQEIKEKNKEMNKKIDQLM